MDELTRRRQAIDHRDAASKRVRRLTLVTAAAAATGTGVVAGVVATAGPATHTPAVREVLAATATTSATTVPAVPEPTATQPAVTGAAAASSPQPASVAPQSVPASAAASAPVAVSGGS
jgi:hypothetical protein